jgi:prepilin peptidase CpaA
LTGQKIQLFFLAAGFIWSAVGAVCDVKSRRVPNKLTYSGILFGLILRTALLRWQGLESGLAGGLVGGGIFFLLYLLRSMGAGDVKLMAAVGCIAGAGSIVQIVIACALAGGLMAVVVMIYKKRTGRTMRNVGALLRFRVTHATAVHPSLNVDNPESVRLPYAVAIAAGALYPFLAILAG